MGSTILVEALVMVHTLVQRESDTAVVKLFDLWSARGGLDYFHFDNLNRVGTSSIPGSHVTVALSDSTSDTKVTLLAVLVVDTRMGFITQPDTKDLHRALYWDCLDRDNFSSIS